MATQLASQLQQCMCSSNNMHAWVSVMASYIIVHNFYMGLHFCHVAIFPFLHIIATDLTSLHFVHHHKQKWEKVIWQKRTCEYLYLYTCLHFTSFALHFQPVSIVSCLQLYIVSSYIRITNEQQINKWPKQSCVARPKLVHAGTLYALINSLPHYPAWGYMWGRQGDLSQF